MISRDSVQTLIGGTAYSSDGGKIGSIGTVYLDNASGEPAWVTVKTGLFGSNESFVPLDQAEQTDDGIRVPYDKDRVKNAPNIETDRELSEQEEDQLYSYYGLGGSAGSAGATPRARRPARRPTRRTARPTTSPARPTPTGPTTAGPTPTRTRHRPDRHHDRRVPRPCRGLRHLGPDDGRRDDPLGGAPPRRHREGRGRPRPAAQVRRHRAAAGERPGDPRGGPGRARADHGREPRPGAGRAGPVRGGARGRPHRGAPGRPDRGRPRRARPALQGAGPGRADRDRRRPQGGHRHRGWRRHHGGHHDDRAGPGTTPTTTPRWATRPGASRTRPRTS